MTTESHTATTLWAIIVGINYYPGEKEECLQGCVQDARTVQHFLEAAKPVANVVVLTATTPLEPSFSRPLEEPQAWPTYGNFVSSLRNVISLAKSGDSVYIHYAGHGARLPSLEQSSQSNQQELALALLSEDGNETRCLRSRFLAKALGKMVEKGLLITLVLDCCFSGSVVRESDYCNFQVRCTSYLPDINDISLQEQRADFFDVADPSRDSTIEEDWILNPNGYAIFAACAPQERAYELQTPDGRRGALTYFLLDALRTLRNKGIELTHRSIHEQLSTRFHVSWPRQTPMRYGNENFAFLGGPLLPPDHVFVPIYRTEDRKLFLRAGSAHGVYQGDTYRVYPFDTPEHADDQDELGLLDVRVNTTEDFESEVIEIDGALTPTRSQMDWKGKLLRSSTPQHIPMKLLGSISDVSQLEEAIKELRFVRLFTKDRAEEPCIFHVTVNKNDEYEVVDALHEKVLCVPSIPRCSDSSTQRLVDVLQHLAAFKYFEGVVNRLPCTTFGALFSLVPTSPAGTSGAFDVEHGTEWEFVVKNASTSPLYLAIFNFAPSWRVKNLISQAGGGGYKIIPPSSRW
jgi:hypothetical protein